MAERKVNFNPGPAILPVPVLETLARNTVEFAADSLKGVRGLRFTFFLVHEFERFCGDGLAAGLIDEAHGDHAVEGLATLVERAWLFVAPARLARSYRQAAE